MVKVTVLSRRKVTDLPEHYGVDLAAEETGGRLVQHIEGLTSIAIIMYFTVGRCYPDLVVS